MNTDKSKIHEEALLWKSDFESKAKVFQACLVEFIEQLKSHLQKNPDATTANQLLDTCMNIGTRFDDLLKLYRDEDINKFNHRRALFERFISINNQFNHEIERALASEAGKKPTRFSIFKQPDLLLVQICMDNINLFKNKLFLQNADQQELTGIHSKIMTKP